MRTREMCFKAGAEPFSTHALETFPDLDIRKIRSSNNQYWNAFKHAMTLGGAERDDQKLFDRFSDKVNDHALFVGWYDYALAIGLLPAEAQIFQVWYFALYPEKLNPDADVTAPERMFPNLPRLERSEQKRALRKAIEFFRDDLTIMRDPQTDRHPLILPCE
jgi:hypothetical protein